MKERPILFSGEMIRAILDGRKTQTRRVVKPVRGYERYNICKPGPTREPWEVWWHGELSERVGVVQESPYGQPGDRLWVREAWGQNPDFPGVKYNAFVCFKADPGHEHDGIKWKPSIHMPRWASRITLEITEVRVERIQDISEEDAKEEGIDEFLNCGSLGVRNPRMYSLPKGTWENGFKTAWNSIYPGNWERNEWVWVISFKRVEG